jgi:hypothetical protein
MKMILATLALGAAMAATPAIAQTAPTAPPVAEQGHHGGFMKREITRQQAQQMADKLFQRLDLNHDGTVTRQEAEQAASQFGGGNGENGGRAEHMINRVFGDSQTVTQAQAEAQALARFDRQDLNHDGVVTPAEREQARAQR